MKNEFALAFNEVLEEKGLPREIILQALESAMVSAYRRSVNASTAQHVEAKVDLDTGKVTISAEKEVVEEVQEAITEVALEDAQKVNPEAKLGDMVIVESTPKDFGRVAAQTARQVIQQRIREAEHAVQLGYYEKQQGEIVSGIVQAVNAMGLTVGLEMKAEGSMPRKEMIPGERFRIHDRVRALIAEVKESRAVPRSSSPVPIGISCGACWKMRSPKFTMGLSRSVPLPANRGNVPKWRYQPPRPASIRWAHAWALREPASRRSFANSTMRKSTSSNGTTIHPYLS